MVASWVVYRGGLSAAARLRWPVSTMVGFLLVVQAGFDFGTSIGR